ncbi:MAG: hypothetical protein A2017_11775 [Lentisphaerae bacterium GWF2_44_16]|nr:MAG: hypothetical protein A2017_11775 [Lentisphaerae bacterium GWF2_44_16]
MNVDTKIKWIKSKAKNRIYEIDWKKYPAVIFESDDWGACQCVKNAEHAKLVKKLNFEMYGHKKDFTSSLETVEELQELFTVLNTFKGMDGLPASFTAFTCLSNPDFERIKKSNYSEYHEIGIDKGFPGGWERGDIVGKMRDGVKLGVWSPEYHTTLHHVSPIVLMELLRSNKKEGKIFRELFDSGAFLIGEHIPEYDGADITEQFKMVKRGMEYFRNAFGFTPRSAVSSDIYPETETVLAINGIRTIQLKTAQLNDDTVTVYQTKPWNNQDFYAEIGEYNPMLDVVYLERNVFFEGFKNHPASETVKVIEKRINSGKPAIISTHRGLYTSIDEKYRKKSLAELKELLRLTALNKDVCCLTTSELGQLYRRGCSLRSFGDKNILRVYSENADLSEIFKTFNSAKSLKSGKKTDIQNNMAQGIYIVLNK